MVMFLMHRVELKVYYQIADQKPVYEARVPNAPCGVERAGFKTNAGFF